MKDSEFDVTIASATPALFVWLEAEGIEGKTGAAQNITFSPASCSSCLMNPTV